MAKPNKRFKKEYRRGPERRTRHIAVYFSDDEMDAVWERASRERGFVGIWIRELVLERMREDRA